jgi:hypothetical protein
VVVVVVVVGRGGGGGAADASISLPGSTVTNLHRHRLQWRSLRIIVDSLALLRRGLEGKGDARCAKAYYKRGQTLAAHWPLASLASPCGLQSATSERLRAHLTRLMFRSAKAHPTKTCGMWEGRRP